MSFNNFEHTGRFQDLIQRLSNVSVVKLVYDDTFNLNNHSLDSKLRVLKPFFINTVRHIPSSDPFKFDSQQEVCIIHELSSPICTIQAYIFYITQVNSYK